MKIKEVGLDGLPEALSGSKPAPGVPSSVLPAYSLCLSAPGSFIFSIFLSHAELLQGMKH